MTYDEFMALDDEQRRAAYISQEALSDLEAERNSFRTDLEQLQESSRARDEELRKTKELNFSLARKVNVGPTKSAEELIHAAMQRGNNV